MHTLPSPSRHTCCCPLTYRSQPEAWFRIHEPSGPPTPQGRGQGCSKAWALSPVAIRGTASEADGMRYWPPRWSGAQGSRSPGSRRHARPVPMYVLSWLLTSPRLTVDSVSLLRKCFSFPLRAPSPGLGCHQSRLQLVWAVCPLRSPRYSVWPLSPLLFKDMDRSASLPGGLSLSVWRVSVDDNILFVTQRGELLAIFANAGSCKTNFP